MTSLHINRPILWHSYNPFHDGANLSMIKKMVDSERLLTSFLSSTDDFRLQKAAVLLSCWRDTSLDTRVLWTCTFCFSFIISPMQTFDISDILNNLLNIYSSNISIFLYTLLLLIVMNTKRQYGYIYTEGD